MEYPLTWGRWRERGFEKQNAYRDNPFSVLQSMAGLKKCACLSTWTDYMISFEICTGSFYPLGLISESSRVIKENKIMFVLSSGAQSSINFSFPPPLHSHFQKKKKKKKRCIDGGIHPIAPLKLLVSNSCFELILCTWLPNVCSMYQCSCALEQEIAKLKYMCTGL